MSLQDDIFDLEAALKEKGTEGEQEMLDRLVTAFGRVEEERDQLVTSTNTLLNFRDLLLGPLMKRVEALEQHSHVPVPTYRADDIDRLLGEVKRHIRDLRRRVKHLERDHGD